MTLLFALSLMAKPMLVTLPFVLLLLDYWPLKRFNGDLSYPDQLVPWFRKMFIEKLPLLLLSVASSLITVFAQQEAIKVVPFPFRVANALFSYVAYLGKTIFPHPLAVSYSFPEAFPWWKIAATAVFILFITMLAVMHLRKRPWFAVGWLWYIGTLGPVIGVIQVGVQAMADRYTYVPLIGIFIIISWGGAEIASKWQRNRKIASALALSILVAFSAITAIQVSRWKNSLSLFRHAVDAGNNNGVVYNNLGVYMERTNRFDDAIGYFEKALGYDPEDTLYLNNLAGLLINANKIDKAIVYIERSIDIQPDQATPFVLYGRAYSKRGDVDTAEAYYRKALLTNSNHVASNINLGVILKERGEYTEAQRHFQTALEIDPEHAGAHHNMALLLNQQEKTRRSDPSSSTGDLPEARNSRVLQ